VFINEREVLVLVSPYEYAGPVSLGDATLVARTQGGAIAGGELYLGTNGSPSTFYAVDALTGRVNFKEPLPGHDVIWAVVVGSDNYVYIGGTNTGYLLRYKPDEKVLENLGTNPSNKWIWNLDASPDGRIYGSTYAPGAGKAFVYDIASASFTDLGVVQPGQDYVRGGGVSGRYFYAGTGTTAHLFRYDREHGEKTEIPLPITGSATSISNIWGYGGKLFVAYGTSLLVLDELTYRVIRQIDWLSASAFDGMLSPPSPYNGTLIYYRNKKTSALWTYDLSSDETAPAEPDLALPGHSWRAANWMRITEGPKAGRHVLIVLTNEIERILYDPIERTVEVLQTDVRPGGIDVQSLETGPDGNLYMGGYQGAMSVYDTSTGQFAVQEKEPHQIEGIGFLNGKAYFGLYGGAVICEYDPMKPFRMGDNPFVAYEIEDEQSRPFTFAAGGGKLFIGTIPGYGQLGGALTVYDPAAGTWDVHRHVVNNQSVIGLAYRNGLLYGGTSIWGGLGMQPSETEARLFEWDVAKAVRTAELKPEVPGFRSPQMIGELSFGPDGLLWGIMWGRAEEADSACALFAMDPLTRTVVKSRVITEGDRGSTWRPFFMRWGRDGMLYTTIGRRLLVFDPRTLDSRMLTDKPVNLMTLGPDGSVYYTQGAQLIKLPVRK